MCVPLHCTLFNQGAPQPPPSGDQGMLTAKQALGLLSPNLLFLTVHSKTLMANHPFALHLAKYSLILKYNFYKLNTQTTSSLRKLYETMLFSVHKLGHKRPKHNI